MGTRSFPGPDRPSPSRPTRRADKYRRLATARITREPDVVRGTDPNLRAIILIDMAKSAAASSRLQMRMRGDLHELVSGALRRRGYCIDSFDVTDTGDGKATVCGCCSRRIEYRRRTSSTRLSSA